MKTLRTPRLSSLSLALACALPLLAHASPGSSSAYRSDVQNTHVEDATSKGVQQVNMIACIMSALRPDAMVNLGAYNALVDEAKCNAGEQSSSSNSGSGSSAGSAPTFTNAVVNSTRASEADPMRARIWIDESQQDGAATIFVNLSASQAPSTANPYGVFHLDYCGKPDGMACQMQGWLDGSADGINYFETEQRNDNGTPSTSTHALRLVVSSADTGAGRVQLDEGGSSATFNFAYNADLFLRNDGVSNQCFTRDASDPGTGMSVWRYGLYDAASGARVERNSGFPIEYTAPDSTVYQGQMGYWGLWLPAGVADTLVSGDTVQRVEYADGAATKTPYTLVKAAGRLTKYTRQTRTLAATDKIRFMTWVNDATGLFDGAQGNTQYEMYWDDLAGTFKIDGQMDCSQNGCQTSNFDIEKSVAPAWFAPQGGVRGWSQSLGGDLFIPIAGADPLVSSAVLVNYRVQSLVYPGELPASLYCLRDCPTAASIAGYFANGSGEASPFSGASYNNWNPTPAEGALHYTLDADSATLTDGAGAAVTFTDMNALWQHPQYQGGVHTGRLFTTLADAECQTGSGTYCDYKVDSLETYYQWETGPNQFNQFAAVKDANGQIVSFDAPLQVSWSVPAESKYGDYAGKSIVLQYGGFGELWGIPGSCVSALTNAAVSCNTPDARYVPSFVIPFDEVQGVVHDGGTPLLVKWLDREIRFAVKDLGQCTSAGLTLADSLVLPDASGLNDPSDANSTVYLGPKPSVSAAPRVVQGEVKY